MNVMIIPAAGRGSRLNFDGPKLLFPLGGKTMLKHLVQRYSPHVDLFVLVINPDASNSVDQEIESIRKDINFESSVFFQPQATGMLDAITIPMDGLSHLEKKIDHVWITWCDQASITQSTAMKLDQELITNSRIYSEYLVFPTVNKTQPYIHFQRDEEGKICQVLQRRENDLMPEIGENDCGLFAMNKEAYFNSLRVFSSTEQLMGSETHERNFLPFIPWLAQNTFNHEVRVDTFAASSQFETIGVNSLEDAEKLLDAWNLESS